MSGCGGIVSTMSPQPHHAAAPRIWTQAELSELAAAALVPPQLNTDPLPAYGEARLDYGMTIGVERTAGGRLWACRVCGGDDEHAYFVLTSSDDRGQSWSAARLVIDPHDAALPLRRRTLVGNLWLDSMGRLWLFFDQALTYFDGRAGVWYTRCDAPDASSPQWSAPLRISDGCALNKPVVLSGGEWVLPVSLWPRSRIVMADNAVPEPLWQANPFADAFHELDPIRMANVLISRDHGRNWQLQGGVAIPQPMFDEHNIVERRDGSLWLTARTAIGNIFQSVSWDKGRTWQTPTDSGIANVSARHCMRRLKSGNLLLVKHGRTIDSRPAGRTELCAFISADDGENWVGGLLLDERCPVSYPDATELDDGTICVSYDYDRDGHGLILMALFTESDVCRADAVADICRREIARSSPQAAQARRDAAAARRKAIEALYPTQPLKPLIPSDRTSEPEASVKVGSRADIYYWKCDRPAALYGVRRSGQALAEQLPLIQRALHNLLAGSFGKEIRITPGPGRGNHLTFILEAGTASYFVRVEDGPEGDDHLQTESAVLAAVSRTGVPVPRVFFTDASRRHIPYAVQVIELYQCLDIHQVIRSYEAEPRAYAAEIGLAVAKWQGVPARGFGTLRGADGGVLRGYHARYANYFNLRLDAHLQLLLGKNFITTQEAYRIYDAFAAHRSLLALPDAEGGVLVHKDLALWNILGTENGIKAFIDWDDAIVGDPMDDISLLGCFHAGDVIALALEGYGSQRSLPAQYVQRFWLHLLRNMIVKAVIRYGAGYFDHAPVADASGQSAEYFLSPQHNGGSLQVFTRERLLTALAGLEQAMPLCEL